MTLKNFLKEKILYIILLLISIAMIEILLLVYDINIFIRLVIIAMPLIGSFIAFAIEYYKKKHFYNQLKQNIENLSEKYLISEIIRIPSFFEGRFLKETLEDTGKSMIENVNKYKHLQEEYKEYIELWIHEIKLPIASRKNGNRE